MDRRRKAGIALIATAVITLLVSLLSSAPAQAAALSITYSPAVVADGMTISVSGNAGGANAPDLYVAVCEDTPTASNCDQSLAGIGGAQAHILVVSPDPSTGAWGPVTFYVRQVIVTGNTPGGYDCKAKGTCVIGTTNSVNPVDHTYNVTKALDFGSVTTPTPTPTPTTTTATPTPTGTSATPTPTTTSATPTATPTPTTTTATPTPTTTSATPKPTPTDSGGLSISYTPSVVADGMTISVRGNAGKAGAPDLYVAVCEDTPTASNCDQSIIGVGGPKAHILVVSPNPTTGAWGPVTFYVRQVIVTGNTPTGYDCKSHGTCVIGTTNSVNPKDHTYNVTAPLNFSSAAVPTLPPTLPPSDGQLTVASTALQAGQSTTVSGTGYAANTPVTVGMYSAPVRLTTATTDATGAFSVQVTVPTSTTGGVHTLVAIGATSAGPNRTLTQSVSVTAAASPSSSSSNGGINGNGGDSDNGGSGDTLAATGAGGPELLPLVAAAALALLLLGLILAVGTGGRARGARHA